MQFLALLPVLFTLLPSAAAHGYLGGITIDGKEYKGFEPGTGTKSSAIRQVDTIDPLKGATNKNLACGSNAKNAKLQATAKPGSQIDVAWTGGGGQKWPHDIGPVLTYMAECTGTDDCTTFDSADAKWFKIDQVGLEKDGKTWLQQDFMSGKSLSVTVPDDLKAGNYLFRSEIIALHLATDKGGAEFYPACAQLQVTGDGTGVPNSTVSIPGAYKDTDPGILDPNVFDTGAKYKFPGPAVSSLAASASNSSSSGSDDSVPSSTKKSSASATATTAASSTKAAGDANGYSSTSSKQCKNKKRESRAHGSRHFARARH